MPQLVIVTGGTAGAQDGTLVSSSNKLIFSALSPSYITAHVRCDAGYQTDDQTFTVPSEVEVSYDGGATWKGFSNNPSAAPHIGDVNVAVRLRQTVLAVSTASSLVTGGTFQVIPLLGNVTGFSASPSGTTVALSWTAVASADHYVIEWGTDGSTYPNTIDSVSGTSYNHTGRTADTVYYYRIKAHNAAHGEASASYATCGAAVQKLFTVAHAIEIRAFNASFATARAGSGSNSVNGNDASTELSLLCQESGGFYLERPMLDFDTTAIPSGATVTEAALRITGTYVSWSSGGFAICKGTWSGASGAVAGDWTNVTISSLGGPTANVTLNTPTDYTISSPASNITKNGTTRLALLERAKDYGNVAPGTGGQSGNNIGGKANVTTDHRPQLKVSYGF